MSANRSHSELSRAELLLLSKFLQPRSPSEFDRHSVWAQLLGWPPSRSISDFQNRRLLAPPPLDVMIDNNLNAAQIRDFLRTNGLPTSGKKVELVSRLISFDRAKAEALVRNQDVLACTADGRSLVEAFVAYENEARRLAERNVVQALQQSNFREAALLVAEFESTQLFPRGLGVDWSHYDASHDASIIQDIYGRIPDLLKLVRPSSLAHLRSAAAMMHLWGTNHLPEAFPEGLDTGLRLDNSTAARMLLFHAVHLGEMQRYRETSVKSLRLLSAEDVRNCEACKALSSKVFLLRQAPQLPYSQCTSEMGCRCTYVVAEFS